MHAAGHAFETAVLNHRHLSPTVYISTWRHCCCCIWQVNITPLVTPQRCPVADCEGPGIQLQEQRSDSTAGYSAAGSNTGCSSHVFAGSGSGNGALCDTSSSLAAGDASRLSGSTVQRPVAARRLMFEED